MDNFDLKKFLAEGKLHEFMSAQDTEDIAGMVADEFTKESADKGDYLKYSVGRVEGEFFELDTEASDMSPEDLDMRGVGEGWGGNFGVKQTEDGLEVRNAEKGGLVATIDAEGNFKMLSADESRAEMGLEEGEMDNFEVELPQDIEAMAQELGGFWMYNGSLDGHFLNSEDKEKSRERDIFQGLSIAYFADEDLLNIMDPISGETLSKERDPKKAIEVIKQNAMGLEEGEEAPKSNKMKKSELKEMIRAAMLAEMEVEETEVFEAEKDEEADEIEVEDEDIEVDTDIDADMEMDADVDGINVKQDADAELGGTKGDVQDNLEAALEAAKSLGDDKLVDQIGNTLTFFTRQHVVNETDMLEDEAEMGLEEAMSDDEIRDMAKKQAFGRDLPEDLVEPAIDIIIDMIRSLESVGIDPQKELEDQDVSPEQIGKIMPLIKSMQEKLTDLVDNYTDKKPKEKSHFEKRLDKMRTQQNESIFPMWNKIK
jgi:hypothetical protein